MENQELSKEKNLLEELQEIIKNSPQGIEDEFSRTRNSWLACFTSNIFTIETYLSSRKMLGLLPHEKIQEAENRLEELKKKVHDLKEQYPERDTMPPDEVKKELLEQLDVLK